MDTFLNVNNFRKRDLNLNLNVSKFLFMFLNALQNDKPFLFYFQINLLDAKFKIHYSAHTDFKVRTRVNDRKNNKSE